METQIKRWLSVAMDKTVNPSQEEVKKEMQDSISLTTWVGVQKAISFDSGIPDILETYVRFARIDENVFIHMEDLRRVINANKDHDLELDRWNFEHLVFFEIPRRSGADQVLYGDWISLKEAYEMCDNLVEYFDEDATAAVLEFLIRETASNSETMAAFTPEQISIAFENEAPDIQLPEHGERAF